MWHDHDMSATLKLGRQGRLVIPAEVRRDLGLAEGDRLEIVVRGDGFTVRPVQSRVEAAAALHGMLAAPPDGGSLVDELLAERRAEAAAELRAGADR